MSHKKQELKIPTDWEVKRYEFYDVDPLDDSSKDDKRLFIFEQEEMLWIVKGDYNIDLGWYGGQDLRKKIAGYCIVLYRGSHWNKCDLLEMFRSKSKDDIVNKLNLLIRAVDSDYYKDLKGYVIDEDDPKNHNSIEDYEIYSTAK